MNDRRRRLITAVAAVAALLIVAASYATADAMDDYLGRNVPQHLNCGVAGVATKSHDKVARCASEQFRLGKPFIARFDYPGDEGTTSRALVSNGQTLFIADMGTMMPAELAGVQVQPCGKPRLSLTKEGVLQLECHNSHFF
jgi:hypothetical protein